jgi:hypothetical protein
MKHIRAANGYLQKLENLGLKLEDLMAAIEGGVHASNSCTENDPASAKGFIAWSCTTRILREVLAPMGWNRCSKGGLESIVSPCGRIGIVVSSGCQNTGIETASPRTKYSKGTQTSSCLQNNCDQLFDDSEVLNSHSYEKPAHLTYFLLHHRDSNEVRVELSLPTSQSKSGHVQNWVERIILPSFSLETIPIVIQDFESKEIEVKVTRRTS